MKGRLKIPPSGEVHLWKCGGLLSPSLDEALNLLAPDEQERARAFRFDEDRWRYLGGALLQRKVLSRYLSCPMQELSFVRNEWGKPSLNREHDSGIQFSLSRSQEVAILAVSGGGEVGVDVEYQFGRVGDDLGMMKQFSQAEQKFIKEAVDSKRAYFEIWARKEAYLKAIGRGLSHPLKTFDVSGKGVVRDWAEEVSGESWWVQSLEFPVEGYASALASKLPSPTIEWFELGAPQDLLDDL